MRDDRRLIHYIYRRAGDSGPASSHTLNFRLVRSSTLMCAASSSDQLLESAIERRAQRLDVLVKVDRGHAALADALRCELKFL